MKYYINASYKIEKSDDVVESITSNIISKTDLTDDEIKTQVKTKLKLKTEDVISETFKVETTTTFGSPFADVNYDIIIKDVTGTASFYNAPVIGVTASEVKIKKAKSSKKG